VYCMKKKKKRKKSFGEGYCRLMDCRCFFGLWQLALGEIFGTIGSTTSIDYHIDCAYGSKRELSSSHFTILSLLEDFHVLDANLGDHLRDRSRGTFFLSGCPFFSSLQSQEPRVFHLHGEKPSETQKWSREGKKKKAKKKEDEKLSNMIHEGSIVS
jgi:hypothetical protein